MKGLGTRRQCHCDGRGLVLFVEGQEHVDGRLGSDFALQLTCAHQLRRYHTYVITQQQLRKACKKQEAEHAAQIKKGVKEDIACARAR